MAIILHIKTCTIARTKKIKLPCSPNQCAVIFIPYLSYLRDSDEQFSPFSFWHAPPEKNCPIIVAPSSGRNQGKVCAQYDLQIFSVKYCIFTRAQATLCIFIYYFFNAKWNLLSYRECPSASKSWHSTLWEKVTQKSEIRHCHA